MYIHLLLHDRLLNSGFALYVWQLPQDLPRAHSALRPSASSPQPQPYAAHYLAGAVARRRGVSGTPWRNARHGQHQPHSNSRHHGRPTLDHRAPWKSRRDRWLRLSSAGEEKLKGALPLWEKVQSRLRRQIGEQAWNNLLRLTLQVTDAITTKGESL